MPTAKPRITITLDSHVHETLSRLAAVSGNSMSQIVAGFCDMAVPSLERLVVVLEQARAAPQEVRAGLVASFERAERDLMPQLMGALDQADMFIGDIEAAARPQQAPGGPAPRGVAAPAQARKRPSTPVAVTRGSGGGKTLRGAPKARALKGSRRGAL
jgi:hypothetical protein